MFLTHTHKIYNHKLQMTHFYLYKQNTVGLIHLHNFAFLSSIFKYISIILPSNFVRILIPVSLLFGTHGIFRLGLDSIHEFVLIFDA